MTIVADLHVHTMASDGLLSAHDVIRLAAHSKLMAVAITDHDTVAGVEEAQHYGHKLGINVIVGIEFSTEHLGKEIHILGYCFDYKAEVITQLFCRLHDSRIHRMEKMLEKLQQLDYNITHYDVCRKAGKAAPSRPHAARVLVEKGYFKTVRDVFEALLNPGMPAYVERYKLTPQNAITVIREAGGFSSWAHPGLVEIDYLLDELIQAGLNGLEVYHPDHPLALEKHYLELVKDKQLIITGGSDFHGAELGRLRNLACRGLTEKQFRLFKNFSHCT